MAARGACDLEDGRGIQKMVDAEAVALRRQTKAIFVKATLAAVILTLLFLYP